MIPIQEYHRPGFTISTDRERLDLDVLHHYLAHESYWWRPDDLSLEKLAQFIAHSLCFGVYAGEQQVGFARAVTDYTTFAYLADVFILPAFQGQGLGKWLIECVLAHPHLQGFRKWTLTTADAHGLYAQFGFIVDDTPHKNMIYRPNSDNRIIG